MSRLLQFERNIEDAVSAYMTEKKLPAFTSRSMDDLSPDNIQVGLQYNGAIDTMRQQLGKFSEYDVHEGALLVQVSTYRSDAVRHHDRLGQCRALLLNSNNGFNNQYYDIFDLEPLSVSSQQDSENNLDQSTLSYSIKWKVNLNNL